MKSLKFRTWKNGKMIYSDDPKWNMPYEFFEQACMDFDDAMLFTGMVDRNGKEIYEGDLVKVYHDDNVFIVKFGKVVRNTMSYDGQSVFPLEYNTFYFESTRNGNAYFSITDNDFHEHDLKGTEVIGNIYDKHTKI